MKKPYASWLKIGALAFLLWIYRDYLPGEPSPFITLNLEMDSKASLVRDLGKLIFPAVWVGCAASILLSPFLSVGVLRVPLTLTFLFSWLFSITILTLSQQEGADGVPKDNMVESGMLALLWLERHKLLDVIHTYSEMIPALLALSSLSLIFAWKPSFQLSIRGKWNVVVCLPIFACIAMAAYSRGGTSAFPTAIGLPIRFASAVAFVASQDRIAEGIHARPVAILPEEKTFEKVVIIMDESVRAGFIDPALVEKWKAVDFGSTVSIGNCSHFSRFVFRRGLRPENLPAAFEAYGLASEEPTVWQYAKAAKYKTIYIDAVGDANFHSGINSDELSYIDDRYNIQSRPTHMRDFVALKKLNDVLQQPGRAFVYLDKQGVHHPYQDKYPPNEKLGFAPPPLKLPEGKELREYQQKLVERYTGAISWSVNKFMNDLFAHGLPENTLLIYTSDHGQSLVENNTKWTHCSAGAGAVDGEGLVPLIVYTNTNTPFSELLARNGRDFAGRYSNFQVFPTILIGLGYSADTVEKLYGASLLDRPPAVRKFLKGGDVRQLEWQTVK